MRLFIAINFSEEIKNSLCTVIQSLKSSAVRGNFTKRENLHLTLVFIGESTRVKDINESMEQVDEASFKISIGGFGRFKRNGGDIYWVGVEKNNSLAAVYKRLYDELKSTGFELESREYRPHLTLGREVILNDSFDSKAFEGAIPQMNMTVSKISLMKSERIDGKLTYTPVYEKELRKD